ncbi:MAG TPA: hypothetical protein VL155_00055 [Terriglobales bacterium]|jgi:hypothetical protein|nr:hypothetical protein [Terriglobales bacterium]
MKTRLLALWLVTLVAFVCLAPAQQPPAKGILTQAQIKKLIPQDYFFAGITASVQPGMNAGVRFANGKVLLAGLVNTSGYSTAIKQKYQALFLTDSRLKVEGSELPPGAYGCGFVLGKFHVMNLAAEDVLSVPAQHDNKLQRAVPLKFVEQDGGYRFYAGKNFVTLQPE